MNRNHKTYVQRMIFFQIDQWGSREFLTFYHLTRLSPFSDCPDNTSLALGDYCYGFYPNANLSSSDPGTALGYCQTKMNTSGKVLSFSLGNPLQLRSVVR